MNEQELRANDGTLCKTDEERNIINKRLEPLFLRDKIFRKFAMFLSVEKIEWYNANIAQRGQDLPLTFMRGKCK